MLPISILFNSFPSGQDFNSYSFHLRKNNTNNLLAKISWILVMITVALGSICNYFVIEIFTLLPITIMIITGLTSLAVNLDNIMAGILLISLKQPP